MSTETIEFSAQDFRGDLLSRKSSGAKITHESLRELREEYIREHPELGMTFDHPALPAEPNPVTS